MTEITPAAIVGSGSLSFEMLRSLTEVLPVMTTPKWVRTRCQPIAVSDVLEILRGTVEDEATESRVVGGQWSRRPDLRGHDAGVRRGSRASTPDLDPDPCNQPLALVVVDRSPSRRCPPKWNGLSSRACVPRS